MVLIENWAFWNSISHCYVFWWGVSNASEKIVFYWKWFKPPITVVETQTLSVWGYDLSWKDSVCWNLVLLATDSCITVQSEGENSYFSTFTDSHVWCQCLLLRKLDYFNFLNKRDRLMQILKETHSAACWVLHLVSPVVSQYHEKQRIHHADFRIREYHLCCFFLWITMFWFIYWKITGSFFML